MLNTPPPAIHFSFGPTLSRGVIKQNQRAIGQKFLLTGLPSVVGEYIILRGKVFVFCLSWRRFIVAFPGAAQNGQIAVKHNTYCKLPCWQASRTWAKGFWCLPFLAHVFLWGADHHPPSNRQPTLLRLRYNIILKVGIVISIEFGIMRSNLPLIWKPHP